MAYPCGDRVSKLILENHKITFDGKSPAHVAGSSIYWYFSTL